MLNTYDVLKIMKLRDGGFAVVECGLFNDGDRSIGVVFACTDIGEALAYIRQKLTAPAPQK